MAPSQTLRAALARAKKGDADAQVFVSDAYYFGKEGVTEDRKLAFLLCHMAAEGGNTVCQYNLALLYYKGEGVERDQRKASAWFMRAAEGGHAMAQYNTALRYESGEGHDAPNMKEAVKWLQAAQAQGHAEAEYDLAWHYHKGDGVKKNPGLALKLWRKCAKHHENGDEAVGDGFHSAVADAHTRIGDCYCDGSGVEKNMPMATQWWTKAAEQGSLFAQSMIGVIHLAGFAQDVPPGTFDRDVPLGVKHLRGALIAVAAIQNERDLIAGEATAKSKAEALMSDFHSAKSCMGCGAPKARKLCSGCLYHHPSTKVRYCGEVCQRIHWRHPTASHKAECGSRAGVAGATRDDARGGA